MKVKDENGNYAMNYQAIIPVLAEAIKEQNKIIIELKNKVESLIANSKPSSERDVFNSNSNAELMQNFPNPFNQETEISFTLPENSSKSHLYIYDMQGKQLKKYELFQKGKSSIKIHANELKAGIYFYTLIVDGKEVSTKKMIITD